MIDFLKKIFKKKINNSYVYSLDDDIKWQKMCLRAAYPKVRRDSNKIANQ